MSVVCPKCGIAKKSGKISCCGRGGSWFDKCGGAGDTKVDHTWHEGLQACKARAQSSIVIGQQLNGAHQASNDSSGGGGDVSVSSKAVSTAVQPLSLTSAILDAVPIVNNVIVCQKIG